MKSKILKCEICDRPTPMRSKIKNKESEHYGKKVCPFHAQLYNKTKFKATKKNKGLKDFFEKHIQIIKSKNKHCADCGIKLSGTVSEVAHILSKYKHSNLAEDDDNIIYLCQQCHSTFDSSFNKRNKMKCFIIAKEKFNLIKDKVKNIDKEYLNYMEG